VVVAVIGTLAGLLLPAMSRSKHRARAVICLNNLKQIALANANYASDNTSVFPKWFIPPPGFVLEASPLRHFWYTLLRPYTGLPLTYDWKALPFEPPFLCPEGEQWIFVDSIAFPNTHEVRSKPPYGYNAFGAVTSLGRALSRDSRLGLGNDTREESVVRPSALFAFGDKGEVGTVIDRVQIPSERFASSLIYPHSGRCNQAYVDGHVSGLPRNLISPNTPDLLRQWHIDAEPHPELQAQ